MERCAWLRRVQRAVVIRKRPPWGEEVADAPWTDHHDSLARVWFQSEGINPSAGDVGRAVQAAARHNPFHPVRDYFDSLVWDGVPAIILGCNVYFHAEDSDYIRAIGPRYLISAVARIFRPGCKVDHMLVLEGPQGKQKSEALRTLAINDSWFTDRLSHVASKDAALEIAGVLIIEIAEMDALTRATSSAMKAFLTRRRDRFRPPYGKHTINLPRQCVFAGTINPPAGGYLKDPDRCAAVLAGRLPRHDRSAMAWNRRATSCGPRRCIDSRRARNGGSRRRNSRHWRPSSRRRGLLSMPGRTPIANGWETVPTSVSRRCSSTCSGSLPSSIHSLPRTGSRGF